MFLSPNAALEPKPTASPESPARAAFRVKTAGTGCEAKIHAVLKIPIVAMGEVPTNKFVELGTIAA
jgi:hypothetical protein